MKKVKAQLKLIMEILTTLLSIEKLILMKNLSMPVVGQIHSAGLTMVKMMIR